MAKRLKERPGEGVAEKHVADFRGMGVADSRAFVQPADLLQRPGDSARIASELHGRGVGQELALPADGRLDQIAEEHAEVAEDDQRQAEQEDGRAAAVSCRSRRDERPPNRKM